MAAYIEEGIADLSDVEVPEGDHGAPRSPLEFRTHLCRFAKAPTFRPCRIWSSCRMSKWRKSAPALRSAATTCALNPQRGASGDPCPRMKARLLKTAVERCQ